MLNENLTLATSTLEEIDRPCEKLDQAIALQIPIHFSFTYFLASLIQIWQGVKLMSECFGGCRLWLEAGTWINPEGDLVWDLNVWLKSSMTQTNFDRHCGQVQRFAGEMRDRLHQESVVVEVNNQIDFY